MLKKLLAVTLLTLALNASAYTPPEVWECDSPGTQGFFISDDPVEFNEAAGACAKHNGVLADISNQNFLLATDIILNCVGENQNAWIRNWDYNPVNPQTRDCLAIYVGFLGPGGGIDLECGGRRYALCSSSNGSRGTVGKQTRLPTTTIQGQRVNVTSRTILTTQTPIYYTQSFNESISYSTAYFNQSISSSPYSVNASAASTSASSSLPSI